MGLYALIGRPNVDEERSYPILIYQSKNNIFGTKWISNKMYHAKVVVFKRRHPMV